MPINQNLQSGAIMEIDRAQALLLTERRRVEQLLKETGEAGQADRTAANQDGDMFDSAQPLTDEGTDASVQAGLRDRLAAIERAEKRLADGSYGLSVQSRLAIPDERLEADPAAELTIEEARRRDEPDGV
jgi:DnaK suppressor protein